MRAYGWDDGSQAFVETVLQEDADVIGLSILSGAHNHVCPRIAELLKIKFGSAWPGENKENEIVSSGLEILAFSQNSGIGMVRCPKTKDLFNNPQHPYTVGLINSIPRINSHQEKLQNIPGTLKTVSVYNDKCPFIERCQYADNACKINKVKLNEIRKSQFSLCLYPERIK